LSDEASITSELIGGEFVCIEEMKKYHSSAPELFTELKLPQMIAAIGK
jgi:hypothetical protein